jgi:hypothetical protein
MAIGMVVVSEEPDGPAPALLNAFCGGTLLFVGTDEIIAPALSASCTPLWKKIPVLWVGFAAMSLMAYWT